MPTVTDRGIYPSLPSLRITPSGRLAIATALRGLPAGSEVWVTSSVDTPLHRMTPCVFQAVAMQARPVDQPSTRTRAVLIVHEWGFPHPRLSDLYQRALSEGWRVVHDCAHAFAFGLHLGSSGAIVAFSLPKLFPVSSGGLLANVPECGETNFSELTDHDRVYLSCLRAQVGNRSTHHVQNWHRLDKLARAFGFESVDCVQPGVIPQAYRIRVPGQFAANQLFKSQHIESAPPFYVGWQALPCHADLSEDYWQAVEVALTTYRQERGG